MNPAAFSRKMADFDRTLAKITDLMYELKAALEAKKEEECRCQCCRSKRPAEYPLGDGNGKRRRVDESPVTPGYPTEDAGGGAKEEGEFSEDEEEEKVEGLTGKSIAAALVSSAGEPEQIEESCD